MEVSPTPEAIRALRERHGLTQLDLAVMLGVTDRTVQRWEMDAEAPQSTQMLPGLWELARAKLGEIRLKPWKRGAKRSAPKAAPAAPQEPRATGGATTPAPVNFAPALGARVGQTRLPPEEVERLRNLARGG